MQKKNDNIKIKLIQTTNIIDKKYYYDQLLLKKNNANLDCCK